MSRIYDHKIMLIKRGDNMLKPKELGLAGGVLWGATVFVLTIISAASGYAAGFLDLIAGVYPGYYVTYAGSIIGAIYGFFDGFICLFLLAWIYNKFSKAK